MIFFLFLLSCSHPFESNSLGGQLQTQAPFGAAKAFFHSGELSLQDPVDLNLLRKILSPFFKNQNKSSFALRAYPNPFHSTSTPEDHRAFAGAYVGGVYDPVNDQIIFVPTGQAPRSMWHRYDCSTQRIEAYLNPFHSTSTSEEERAVGTAYMGGVYDPVNNQIIFVPFMQAPRSIWHRYNCTTQSIEAYSNPFDSTSDPEAHTARGHAYYGGVYDPVNKQIIFVPWNQAPRIMWHRYDCVSQTIEAYPNPFHSTSTNEDEKAVVNAYHGGVYDPVNNQIIFVPVAQAQQTTWHRYDCTTQSIKAYSNPFDSTSTPEDHTAVASAYVGGVYDPLNNQIIFIPYVQATRSIWHRYDCVTQSIEAYPNPFDSTSTSEDDKAIGASYGGGVYDPVNNQIIFAPYHQSTQASWHRYDCATQTIQAYNNPFDSTSSPPENQALNLAYHGGVYDPHNNQIIFIPHGQANRKTWHAFQNFGKSELSRQFAGHCLFNKF
jgi:hypothetical protein